MSEFIDVTVVKQANVYFEGKVTSRSILFGDGTKKTLGIMLPGEYEFGTDLAEDMEILSGELTYKLPGSTDWLVIKGKGSFHVPAQSKFQLKVTTVTDYCCSFLK